jgi:hypothetical protein
LLSQESNVIKPKNIIKWKDKAQETFASVWFPNPKGELLKELMENNRRQILTEGKINPRWGMV